MFQGRNLLNRRLADGIRRVGFRKWYERELLSGHAHLVLLLFAVLGLLGCLEVMPRLDRLERVLNVAYIVACAGIGLWAMRRYLFLLMHAEEVAHQANCPQCGSYGRLAVVSEDRPREATTVRCLKCSHEWEMLE